MGSWGFNLHSGALKFCLKSTNRKRSLLLRTEFHDKPNIGRSPVSLLSERSPQSLASQNMKVKMKYGLPTISVRVNHGTEPSRQEPFLACQLCSCFKKAPH